METTQGTRQEAPWCCLTSDDAGVRLTIDPGEGLATGKTVHLCRLSRVAAG